MENKKPIIISTICFLVALLLVYAYVSVRTHEMTKDFGEQVRVVTAAAAIPEYGMIRREMLGFATVYRKFVQPKTVTVDGTGSEAEEAALKQIVGKSAFVNIYPGEQITLTNLIQQDGRPVLDRQLEKNNRAVTIQISPQSAVGRLIRPGNHVDIMAAVKYEQNNVFQIEVKTVFQNVLVLATGRNLMNAVPNRINRAVLSTIENEFEINKRKDLYTTNLENGNTSRPSDDYTWITVQLSAADAEKLLLLQNEVGDSALYFTLRNGADQQVAAIETTLLDQVLGPDSAYGRSKIKPPNIPPPNPKYYDSKGGQLIPVY